MKAPKIIHQIWGGSNPLPDHFKQLSETWKKKHPDWEYEFWDDKKIDDFVTEHYPNLLSQFRSFPYNMQRWDTIRYLILYKLGGVYIDFDTECIKPIDSLIEYKDCWFALEPEEHRIRDGKDHYLSSAIIGAIPGHYITKKIIEKIFNNSLDLGMEKCTLIMQSSGPHMLIDLYEHLSEKEKEDVHLISSEYLSPLSAHDVWLARQINAGEEVTNYLNEKMNKAYAVHYFFNDWITV